MTQRRIWSIITCGYVGGSQTYLAKQHLPKESMFVVCEVNIILNTSSAKSAKMECNLVI